MNRLSYFMLVFLGGCLSAFTLPALEEYIITKNYLYLLLGIVLHFALLILYIKLLETENMEQMFALIKMLAIILLIFINILFFYKKLTISIVIGILLSIPSIYLLGYQNTSVVQ